MSTKRSVEEAANSGQPPASKPKLPPDFGALFKDLRTKKRFLRADEEYDNYRYQYSYTSHKQYGYMDPGAIIYPQQGSADDDVKKVIAFAGKYRLRIAVRTGGHQYSGASSTNGDNILLDMSEAYKDDFDYNPQTGLVRVGVSFELAMLNRSLGTHGLFVPHGQCSHVHLGGHAQTGGYGQLGRAFGLLADHIEELEILIADGRKITASRDASDPFLKDIFYAVLGGSPGNFGVLTHVTLKPHKDDDYPESIGLKAFSFYNKDKLLQLMRLKAMMADDVDFPGDIDFCVTVMSGAWDVIHAYAPDTDEQQFIGSLFSPGGPYGDKPKQWFWPPMILVYLQWAGTGPDKGGATKEQATEFFNKVKTAMNHIYWPLRSDETHTEMSVLTTDWVFTNVREYNLPYEKRTYVTRSTTLAADKWPEVVTNRIHALESDWLNGCKIVVQIQHFGGHKSAFIKKADNRTAFSWRADSTVWCTLDSFYDEKDLVARISGHKPKEIALKWQEENDRVLKGPDGCFSRNEDRRVLWATYGDYYKGEFNMGNVYRCYYESQSKYDELCRIKKAVDVMGVFTSNAFCVGVPPGLPSPPLTLVQPTVIAGPVAATKFRAQLPLQITGDDASFPQDIDDKYAAPLRKRFEQRNKEAHLRAVLDKAPSHPSAVEGLVTVLTDKEQGEGMRELAAQPVGDLSAMPINKDVNEGARRRAAHALDRMRDKAASDPSVLKVLVSVITDNELSEALREDTVPVLSSMVKKLVAVLSDEDAGEVAHGAAIRAMVGDKADDTYPGALDVLMALVIDKKVGEGLRKSLVEYLGWTIKEAASHPGVLEALVDVVEGMKEALMSVVDDEDDCKLVRDAARITVRGLDGLEGGVRAFQRDREVFSKIESLKLGASLEVPLFVNFSSLTLTRGNIHELAGALADDGVKKHVVMIDLSRCDLKDTDYLESLGPAIHCLQNLRSLFLCENHFTDPVAITLIRELENGSQHLKALRLVDLRSQKPFPITASVLEKLDRLTWPKFREGGPSGDTSRHHEGDDPDVGGGGRGGHGADAGGRDGPSNISTLGAGGGPQGASQSTGAFLGFSDGQSSSAAEAGGSRSKGADRQDGRKVEVEDIKVSNQKVAAPPRVLRVLSIDGGGAKGIVPATVLLKLMEQLGKLRGQAPAAVNILEYFDVMVGTSIGGICSVMLAAGKTPDFLQQRILELASTVFRRQPWKSTISWLLTRYPMYNTSVLEEQLEIALRADAQKPPQYFTDLGFECYVTTRFLRSQGGAGTSMFIGRSDPGPPQPLLKASSLPLLAAMRATSAAQSYFAAVRGTYNEVDGWYVDGGSGWNNPTSVFLHQLASEACKVVVVSLGCGVSADVASALAAEGGSATADMSARQRMPPLQALTDLIEVATDVERHHLQSERYCGAYAWQYYRFNPEFNDLVSMDCGDRRKLETLRDQTAAACDSEAIQVKLTEAATLLNTFKGLKDGDAGFGNA